MIKILKNTKFTTNEVISSTASTMDYRGDYFLNYNTGQGGLTSQFNVISFLDNTSNFLVTDGFYQYLNNNFTSEQILAIKNDSIQLSNSLNYYYNSVYVNIVNPTANLFTPSGVTFSSQMFSDNLYLVSGEQSTKSENGTIYSNSADSYYVNVVLFESFNLLDDSNSFLEPDINNGYQIEKETIQLNGIILSGQQINERIVNIVANKQSLIQGFVNINLLDSPFNDYSNYGLDSDISSFSGQSVLEIDAEITGNISSTENIYPSGITNVLIGASKNFVFKTVNNLKSINSVMIDGVLTDYDTVDNLPKEVAGQYRFSSVTQNHNIVVNFV